MTDSVLNYDDVLELQILVDSELDYVSGLIVKNDYFTKKEKLLEELKEKLINLAIKYIS